MGHPHGLILRWLHRREKYPWLGLLARGPLVYVTSISLSPHNPKHLYCSFHIKIKLTTSSCVGFVVLHREDNLISNVELPRKLKLWSLAFHAPLIIELKINLDHKGVIQPFWGFAVMWFPGETPRSHSFQSRDSSGQSPLVKTTTCFYTFGFGTEKNKDDNWWTLEVLVGHWQHVSCYCLLPVAHGR